MRKRALDCGLGFPVLFSSLESGTPPGKDVICSRACPKPWLGDAGFSPRRPDQRLSDPTHHLLGASQIRK